MRAASWMQKRRDLLALHSCAGCDQGALALALCAAVGFTISIPLAFLGVTGIWSAVVGFPLLLAFLDWRDVRDWWRPR